MPKKTIKVEKILDRVNHLLLHSNDKLKGERRGLIVLLDGILIDSGNYKGFGYLDETSMKHSANGVSVGVRRDAADKFLNTDPTRVVYYK